MRNHDPIDIVAIYIRLLPEALAVLYVIGAAIAICGIMAGAR